MDSDFELDLPVKKPRKRRKRLMMINLNIMPASHTLLKAHAYDLRQPTNKLIRDILECWLASMTDCSKSLFHPSETGVSPPEMPVEPYPGYIRDLGFE